MDPFGEDVDGGTIPHSQQRLLDNIRFPGESQDSETYSSAEENVSPSRGNHQSPLSSSESDLGKSPDSPTSLVRNLDTVDEVLGAVERSVEESDVVSRRASHLEEDTEIRNRVVKKFGDVGLVPKGSGVQSLSISTVQILGDENVRVGTPKDRPGLRILQSEVPRGSRSDSFGIKAETPKGNRQKFSSRKNTPKSCSDVGKSCSDVGLEAATPGLTDLLSRKLTSSEQDPSRSCNSHTSTEEFTCLRPSAKNTKMDSVVNIGMVSGQAESTAMFVPSLKDDRKVNSASGDRIVKIQSEKMSGVDSGPDDILRRPLTFLEAVKILTTKSDRSTGEEPMLEVMRSAGYTLPKAGRGSL